MNGRVLSAAEARKLRDRLDTAGCKLVFSNGCFDILHRGHVSYLEFARAQGDALIVGLNSDSSVLRNKGPGRPINAETDRAVVLYWYAVHGRMIGNEIVSKAWLLHDSLRFQRSDAALVRIVVPVQGTAIDAAQREGLLFAHDVLPYLPHLWS